MHKLNIYYIYLQATSTHIDRHDRIERLGKIIFILNNIQFEKVYSWLHGAKNNTNRVLNSQ